MCRKILIFCFFFIITNVYSQDNFYRAVYSGDIDFIYRYYINDSSPRGHFNFSKSDLRILRNTIYARHGYIFRSRDLQEHFQKFEWYKGTKENVENELTENERRIIRIITATEAANPPSLNDLIGLWESPAPLGSDASTLGFVKIYLNQDGIIDILTLERKRSWSFDGKIFRSSGIPTKEYNVNDLDVIENFRINFIEYNGTLYRTCTFFEDSSTPYDGWDFYGPNRRPPAERWGYSEQ
jgi:hypothetical protein